WIYRISRIRNKEQNQNLMQDWKQRARSKPNRINRIRNQKQKQNLMRIQDPMQDESQNRSGLSRIKSQKQDQKQNRSGLTGLETKSKKKQNAAHDANPRIQNVLLLVLMSTPGFKPGLATSWPERAHRGQV
ncbi:MAG: hypothetical protein OXR72_00750, partial [Gemmatimonadota bacterium]|nr:hypothetical protein [Gemmatimonadota bacterium]